MSIIQCPECKNDISSKATSCPHCGYPLRANESDRKPSRRSAFGEITFAFSILAMIMLFTGGIALILPVFILAIVAVILGIIDIFVSRSIRVLNALGLLMIFGMVVFVIKILGW